MISIDGLLTSTTFIADIDDAMAHFEVRSRYVEELGRKLAILFDRNVAGNFILAARTAATITGEAGGSQITNAAMATDVNVLTAALFAAAQTLDEKWVGKDGRQAFVRPAQFYALAQNPNLLNKFLGGSGGIAQGSIDSVAGFPIIKTTNLPSTDLTADATTSPSAQASYTKTVASVNHQDAVGTVKLLDVAVEADREVRRQGWFFIAKYAAGHGILRPEAAVELSTP